MPDEPKPKSWSRRRKLPPGPVLYQLWMSGHSYQEIADLYECTRLQTVYQGLKRWAIAQGMEWPLQTPRRQELWSIKVRRAYEEATVSATPLVFVVGKYLAEHGHMSMASFARKHDLSPGYLKLICNGRQARCSALYAAHIYRVCEREVPPDLQEAVHRQRERLGRKVKLHSRWDQYLQEEEAAS